MTTVETDPIVADYLHRLDVAAEGLAPGLRAELLGEIREHLQEAQLAAGATDEVTIRNILERMGPPEDIVSAAAESSERPLTRISPNVGSRRSGGQTPAKATPRKRPRRRLLILVACLSGLLLAAFGVGVGYLLVGFEPLRADARGLPFSVRAEAAQVTRMPSLLPSHRSYTAYGVLYQDGTWLERGFTLRNDSPFPIDVDEIGIPGYPGEPLLQVSVSMSASTKTFGPSLPEPVIAFSPFTLRPHDARYIVVRWELVGCSLDGSLEEHVSTVTELVKFRSRIGPFTISRSEFLPLAYSIAVWGRGGCPG